MYHNNPTRRISRNVFKYNLCKLILKFKKQLYKEIIYNNNNL
jgi:hypothetical protein